MVFSSSPQAPSTYVLGKLFWMPMEGGSQRAFAVPSYVGYYLISVYTILVTTIVISIWCFFFASFLYLRMRQNKLTTTSTALWNKRYSLVESLLELLQHKGSSKRWKELWYAPMLVIVSAFLVGHVALSIFSPSAILLDHAAPVNPNAVFVPNNNISLTDPRRKTQGYTADTPATQRAVGGAQVASSDIQSKATVRMINEGTTADGEIMNRYEYSYGVSGRDMGLQNYPTLQLTVTGACITEYGWLDVMNETEQLDSYTFFGNTSNIINPPLGPGYDGAVPVAFFKPGPYSDFAQWETNMTWAAYVSSAYRLSYSPGSDPFYVTKQIDDPDTGDISVFPYIVKGGRPVLSCWEQNVWSYEGHTTKNIAEVNANTLPGLDLPDSIQLIFARYLAIPKIVSVGGLLYLSALQSGSLLSLGTTFDASQSSMLDDLQRLVLTAYIATVNVLTDTTLYANLSSTLDNMVTDQDGKVLDGVGDFVVWTGDVAALSLKYIIMIPTLALTMWVLVYILLHFTRLRIVKNLDASVLHETILGGFPDAKPCERGWETARGYHDPAAMHIGWDEYGPQQSNFAGAPETSTAYDPRPEKPIRDSGISVGSTQAGQPFSTPYHPRHTRETVTEVYDAENNQFGMVSPASATGTSTRDGYLSVSDFGNETGNTYVSSYGNGNDAGEALIRAPK